MNELTTICIYDPAGANYLLGRSFEFPITDKCERSAKVMGDDFVRLVFESTHKVVFDAFSFIRYNGQTFFLREKYIPKPKGTFKEDSGEVSTAYFSYDVKFVSVANMLDKYVCYRHVVVSGDKGGEWNEPEININGNLETMYKIIMGSIQQVSERLSDHMEFTSMLKTIPANGLNSDGTINTSKVKLTAGTKLLTFNFSGDKIANVCTTVANNFTNDDKKDTEWYITEDNGSLTLHFSKYVDEEYGVQYVSDYISNNNSADSFAHPQKSGGLKDVDYAQEWSGITNVIVPYGSTRNMTYQAAKGIDEVTQMQSTFGKRLRLKPNTYYYVKDKNGKDASFLTDQQGAVRNNSVDTGIEEVRFYDEIYPQGHFKVTSVETKNKRQDGEIVPEYTVDGVAIDSSGNEIQPAEGFYPIAIEEGATLSVRFEKGLLNGREFEIANKTRKDEGRTTYSLKFTIVADGSLEDGTLIPSGNFIPREGDEFALFNMKMPEVYITAAEKELAQRVYSDLEEAVSKRPEVKCTSDPTTWDKEMALGYQFQVKSEKFNSEDTFVSRVISYSYKLTKPKEIQFNLASAIMQGTLSSMNDQIADVTHQAGGLEQRAINLSRRGWRDAAEMAEMVDSLAADMMLVGNEKYQFAFTAGIEIVNSNNQTTAIKIGEGTLQHTQDPYISDYTCQGWWSHGAVTLSNGHTENGSASLVSLPDTPFYLYAVVGQNSDNISFELQDKEQDGEAYLLLGILSSAFTDTIGGVTTNYRVFNRTNGYTQISGGTITTEQIQDAGRNLIIDFQSSPPRIIARNGAEIIGNIKFKSSDEMTAEEQLAALGIGVDNAQSAAEDAKKAAEAEAAKIREEYKAAIAESEDDMTEALAASVAEINGGLEALQKQVDGEVSSYFYPYSPIGNDESVRMDVEPMSEWLQNYNLTDGVYVLKEGATNELINNIGDTFTNTEIFESEDSTPLAGKSWRWCDATNTPSIEKYIVVQYEKDGITKTMKLHWHIITDTDAIRALEAAKNAQATADNKTTTFVGNEDPTNYGIGDLWILPNNKTLNGTTYKKGTILTANKESETFDASHWSEDVKYTDDTIAYKAVDAAANAKTAADNAQADATAAAQRLEDWADDGVISPIEKQGIKDEKTRINADKEQITSSCNQYGISIASYETAYNNYVSVLDSIINATTETVSIPSGFKASQTTYYARRTSVLNAISQQAQTVAEAYARQQAQQALDGLELGGENLVLESKGDSNKNIRANNTSTSAEFQYSCKPTKSDTYGDELQISLTCSTQGKYAPDSYSYTTCIWVQCKKETIKGKKYTISFDARLLPSSSADNCTVYFRAAGTGYSTTQMGKAIIDKTKKRYSITVDSNAESDTNTYSYFTLFLSRTTTIYISNVKVEQGNKATGWSPAPEDVDSKANAIKAIADEAKENADESNAQLANMSNDSILTPQEKGSVADEWACIEKEYTQNEINKESVWGNATVTEWTAYNKAYTTLQTYVDELKLTDRENNTTIVKSTFQTNFANYYSANVAFLNALSKKVAELEVAAMEIGGRNLLRNSAIVTHSAADTTNNYSYKVLPPTVGLQPNTNYVFSVDKSEMTAGSDTAFTVYIIDSSINNRRNGFTIPISNERQSVSFKTMPSVTDTDVVLVYAGRQGTTAGKAIKLTNIKLEQGTKATDWTPAPEDVDDAIAAVDSKAQALEYLKTALEDGSTEIAGGLTMTNVLMLKNLDDYVTAGMSGLTTYKNKEDKVLMWGGGTYEEAYAAAYSDTYNTGSGTITTLLKKDGTGKIGVFKIGEDKVEIEVPNQGLITIDTSNSGESGICISKGSDIRTIISDLSINDVATKRRSVKSYINIDYTQKDVTLDEVFGGFSTFEPYYVNGVPIALELTSVKMTLYGYSTRPVDLDAVYTIKGFIVIDTSQSVFWDENCIFEATFNGKDIKDNKYVYELSIPKSSRDDIIGNLNTIRVDYDVSSNSADSLIFDKSDLEVKGTIWMGSSLELARESIIIGNDGISCMSGQSRFLVKNTNGGQIILVDGLPTKKDNLKKGQLWNNNGVLSIF